MRGTSWIYGKNNGKQKGGFQKIRTKNTIKQNIIRDVSSLNNKGKLYIYKDFSTKIAFFLNPSEE